MLVAPLLEAHGADGVTALHLADLLDPLLLLSDDREAVVLGEAPLPVEGLRPVRDRALGGGVSVFSEQLLETFEGALGTALPVDLEGMALTGTFIHGAPPRCARAGRAHR